MQGSAMMYAIGPAPAGRISPLRVYAHSFSSGRGAVSWHFLCPAFCAKSSGWIRTFILVVRLPTFPVCPAARAFMSVTLDQHYGRNIFRFFCRAASRSSVFFFWRSISFCGSSCPSSFMDLAIAASACAFSRFENMESAKEFRNLERTRFIEYRSEEHTSELQSRLHLVCRLLLEKKKNKLH